MPSILGVFYEMASSTKITLNINQNPENLDVRVLWRCVIFQINFWPYRDAARQGNLPGDLAAEGMPGAASIYIYINKIKMNKQELITILTVCKSELKLDFENNINKLMKNWIDLKI